MTDQLTLFDAELLKSKLSDAQTPGFVALLDPGEAERAGAFAEDALDEAEAFGSTEDCLELFGEAP